MWRAPHLLWLLTLVPLLVGFLVWALRRRRQALRQFAEARLLDVLTPDLDDRRQSWRAGLLTAAVTLLVLALAGPRWGFHWEEVHQRGVDIVVALDTSRSMLAEDVKPNRLERAKLAIQDLVKQLRGDRIGLVPFAGSAFVQCPLTLDYGAFMESLRAVRVGIIPKGGTALAKAITSGISAFEGRAGQHAVFILITDGEDHEGQVKEATQQAADKGITIYTIAIGTTDGDLIPLTVDGRSTFLKDRRGQVVKSRLGAALLQEAAIATGGAYIYATGPTLGLDEVYTRYISKREKRDLTSTLERRFEERFQLPLLLAVGLLGLEPFVGNRRSSPGERRRWLVRWRKTP